MDAAALIDAIRSAVPEIQALYLFGSAARGDAGPESDIDLALLAPRPLAPRIRWEIQERLAVLASRNVDVIDLRDASAVMRVNVLDDGQLLLDTAPYERALFEATALADYARLQEERREILEQIAREGHVYG